MRAVMTAEQVSDFLDQVFPQIHAGGRVYTIEGIEAGLAKLRLSPTDIHLRPGGTVSGPAMMALADFAAYAVILGHIGPKALAVTTNLNINFLRKPELGQDLLAEGRILKLGRRLVVTDVSICRDGDGEIVAHATATYSIPPQ